MALRRLPRAFLLVPLCLGLGSVRPLHAAPPQSAPQPLPPDVEAVNLLTHGRRYERAIELLQTAIKEKPDDGAAHLALGCAYADRAAALSYAFLFTQALKDEQKAYPNRRKEWEEERDAARKENKPFTDPAPPVPPTGPLPLRDDNTPFRLTDAELYARLSELYAGAQTEWDKAATLAKTDAEKANVEWVRGWGMRLLQTYGEFVGQTGRGGASTAPPDASANDHEVGAAPKPPDPALVIKNVPTKKAAFAALTKATLLAPDNAVYWQSVGDAEDDDAKKTGAYEKSLSLKPRNGPLWAELYRSTLGETYDVVPDFALKPDEKKADVLKGIGYLARAAKYDGTNAWYVYEEAALRANREAFGTYVTTRRGPSGKIKPEDAQKAVSSPASQQNGRALIALIEAGNQRYEYHAPRYLPSVPPMLAPSWDYVDHIMFYLGEQLSHVIELARAACGYGLAAAVERGDTAEGVRATEAVLRMGQKLSGDMPLKDKNGRPLNTQVGNGNVVIRLCLTNLVKIYQATGDKEAEAAVQAEIKALQARITAYLKRANDTLQIWEMYF